MEKIIHMLFEGLLWTTLVKVLDSIVLYPYASRKKTSYPFVINVSETAITATKDEFLHD